MNGIPVCILYRLSRQLERAHQTLALPNLPLTWPLLRAPCQCGPRDIGHFAIIIDDDYRASYPVDVCPNAPWALGLTGFLDGLLAGFFSRGDFACAVSGSHGPVFDGRRGKGSPKNASFQFRVRLLHLRDSGPVHRRSHTPPDVFGLDHLTLRDLISLV